MSKRVRKANAAGRKHKQAGSDAGADGGAGQLCRYRATHPGSWSMDHENLGRYPARHHRQRRCFGCSGCTVVAKYFSKQPERQPQPGASGADREPERQPRHGASAADRQPERQPRPATSRADRQPAGSAGTVSTDDAYVNGDVTFVAPRVAGQVIEVLVDDNYRVKRGALLARLDKEPFQLQVDIKKADAARCRNKSGGCPGTGRPASQGPARPATGADRNWSWRNETATATLSATSTASSAAAASTPATTSPWDRV